MIVHFHSTLYCGYQPKVGDWTHSTDHPHNVTCVECIKKLTKKLEEKLNERS